MKKPSNPVQIGNITVHCDATLMPIKSLKPHHKNPNKHSDVQIELLAKIILKQGWRWPVIVSMNSGLVVAGHARLLAAEKLGLESVPVQTQIFIDEKAEIAFLLADNKISELSERDPSKVKSLLEELDDGSIEFEETGFLEEEVEKMMTAAPPGEGSQDDAKESKEIECPACGHTFSPTKKGKKKL